MLSLSKKELCNHYSHCQPASLGFQLTNYENNTDDILSCFIIIIQIDIQGNSFNELDIEENQER